MPGGGGPLVLAAVNLFCTPVEWREDQSRQTPGVLHGVIITYGERAGDRPEVFSGGSLHWPEEGVMLREQHNRQAPIARFVPMVDGDRVLARCSLPDTQRGRDAALMVREGHLVGLSVEFRSLQEHRANGLRVITRASLEGVGLVDSPAYSGSTVAVRHRHRVGRRRLWL